MSLCRRSGGDLWKYYLGFGLARAGTIAVLPIVARVLGPEQYAYFEASAAVMLAAMVIGDAGVGAAVVRFVNDPARDPGAVVRSAAAVQLTASLVALVVAAAPVALLTPSGTSVLIVLLALGTFTLVEGFGALGAGLLRAASRNGTYLALAFVRLSTAATVGAVGALVAGMGGALFGIALAGFGFAVFAGRATLHARRGQVLPVAGVRREMLRYSLPLMLTSLATWTLSLSDRVFLRALSSPIELAQYSASYRTGSVVALFVAAPLALAWLPVARTATAPHELRLRTLRWSLALAWAAIGGGTMVVLASPALVPLLFGEAFEGRNGIVAAVVVGGWLAGLYILIATEILLDESTRRLAPVMIGVVLLNLALNALLIPVWDASGAAVATVASYAALPVATMAMVDRRSLEWLFDVRHVLVIGLLLAGVVAAAALPLLAAGTLGIATAVSWRVWPRLSS